jgi:hypothetical protein
LEIDLDLVDLQVVDAGVINTSSVFGGFEKAMLSGVGSSTLLQTVKLPEMLYVVHSLQVCSAFHSFTQP